MLNPSNRPKTEFSATSILLDESFFLRLHIAIVDGWDSSKTWWTIFYHDWKWCDYSKLKQEFQWWRTKLFEFIYVFLHIENNTADILRRSPKKLTKKNANSCLIHSSFRISSSSFWIYFTFLNFEAVLWTAFYHPSFFLHAFYV